MYCFKYKSYEPNTYNSSKKTTVEYKKTTIRLLLANQKQTLLLDNVTKNDNYEKNPLQKCFSMDDVLFGYCIYRNCM